MSKLSKKVRDKNKKPTVTNFMGGTNYKLNPIEVLELIASSSIFGESSYYRSANSEEHDNIYNWDHKLFTDDFYKNNLKRYQGMSTVEIFEQAIDDALTYNFKGTLELATKLRYWYNMRINPQIIMVRAAIHPERKHFTARYPSRFTAYNKMVMTRADDPLTQLTYYLYLNDGMKNNIPSILKRSIAKMLSELDLYELNKYKNHEIGMINAIRITHATSKNINEFLNHIGNLDHYTTWEQKRSSGMDWKTIYETTYMGHMALLRNIRNVFTEVEDLDFCRKYMDHLKATVIDGKQFPFRYYDAYTAVEQCDNIHHKQFILDYLESCIEISTAVSMPILKGKTVCLSDNSRSAWGVFRDSDNRKRVIAIIDNLSSVIAARCSEEGEVVKFGDDYKTYTISKATGILKTTEEISRDRDSDVGGGTEGGLWRFLSNAINNKIHYDNIFIFSDQQAGTGKLYGRDRDVAEYSALGLGVVGYYQIYINVFKLIELYREKVNPKVNVFTVQTAGYDNVVFPTMMYRYAVLSGWTGKEINFAAKYIESWNDIENSRNKK